MKAKDLRERNLEDLRELEKSLAKDTFQHRFKNFTNRLDDTSIINKTKRDLARVKTLIKQLEKPAEKVVVAATQKAAKKSVSANAKKAAHSAAKTKKTSKKEAK